MDEQWAAYDSQHFHGSIVHALPVTDALADFDAVVEALRRAHERGDDNAFVNGYVEWRDSDDEGNDAPALLESIKQVRQQDRFKRDIKFVAYALADDRQFWQRWRRADWYWANIVIEWAFLSGLVYFVLWPGIRNRSALRWATHFGLLPVLFLFPTYLGYATFTFTSVGPSGGILYPFLLWYACRGFFTEFDSWVLARLPQILEPLSTPIGSWLSLTGMGMPGPTCAVLSGVLLGGLIVGTNFGIRQWIKRHPKRRIF
ncbi:MAG: hypothetical protein GY778_07685 [bacterium]|nr:hypothetical protein [bacterium]